MVKNLNQPRQPLANPSQHAARTAAPVTAPMYLPIQQPHQMQQPRGAGNQPGVARPVGSLFNNVLNPLRLIGVTGSKEYLEVLCCNKMLTWLQPLQHPFVRVHPTLQNLLRITISPSPSSARQQTHPTNPSAILMDSCEGIRINCSRRITPKYEAANRAPALMFMGWIF